MSDVISHELQSENYKKPFSEPTESKNFFDVLQTAVTNRFLRPYNKNNLPVTYEVTQDRALLHQYYCLREVMYKTKHSKIFSNGNCDLGEDLHDKISHIIIARRGNLCLGGCRLVIREPDELWNLPMESDDFKLRELLPDLSLDKVRHAEISRFAVMDDCGEEDVFFGLCKALYSEIANSDIHYLFVKSPYKMARNWRFIANSFGVKNTKIVEDLHPKDDSLSPDIKWYLVMSDVSDFSKSKTISKAVNEASLDDVTTLLN